MVRRATIVGAGVFGTWIAHVLNRRGWHVTIHEAHGPANARASSGGETRIIRSAYGRVAIYARWARRSLPEWRALERRAGERLFVGTGALFLARQRDWLADTERTLRDERIPCELLDSADLGERFPQLHCGDASAIFEPDAGVLFARRAVQALVRTLIDDGVRLVAARANAEALLHGHGSDALIFAVGPWLPQLFPETLSDAVLATRQEVFFFGAPPGDDRFSPARLPAWVAFEEGVYGLPDLEHRGVKVAIDAHGPPADPETMDRLVAPAAVAAVREVLTRTLPALADAPLLESRVCQYENTTDGHLLIDRLPGHDRVWIAGGGSGHGFKHGPMVGRYVADLVEGAVEPDPLFALRGRPPRRRAVY